MSVSLFCAILATEANLHLFSGSVAWVLGQQVALRKTNRILLSQGDHMRCGIAKEPKEY
jgi:hypothetical protein